MVASAEEGSVAVAAEAGSYSSGLAVGFIIGKNMISRMCSTPVKTSPGHIRCHANSLPAKSCALCNNIQPPPIHILLKACL